MQKLHDNISLFRRRSLIAMKRLLLLKFVLLGLVCYGAPPLLSLRAEEINLAGQKPVTHEIRYHIIGAREVLLAWGINGWQPVPAALRPPGTVIKQAIMYTPMKAVGDTYITQVQAPMGATLDYAFQITRNRDGAAMDVWDNNGTPARDYHTIAKYKGIEEIEAEFEIQEQPLVTQEIHYHLTGAGEVFLVWGLNDWTPIPEGQRPLGTVIKNSVMHTLMALSGDVFGVKVKVPYGSIINYGFLITKKQDGTALGVWDANGGPAQAQITALPGGVTGVQATISLAPRLGARLSRLLTFCLFLSCVVLLHFILQSRSTQRVQARLLTPRAARTILLGLIALGFGLRLWMAWSANQVLPDSPDRLKGDETGYDGLAYWLTQGSFSTWSGRVPVYPVFLAACYLVFGHSYARTLYIQAFIGALTIPLTFFLARRFTQEKSALLAAALVAVDPALIFHVVRLYTEILYTPLLLLALLGLLRAIEQPRPQRFILAGVLLAIANLCRPTAALFPLLVPFLLPQVWPLPRKLFLSLVYVGAMAAAIAPWTYNNYKTHHIFLPLSVSTAVLWQGSPEFYHLMEQKRTLEQIWDEQLNPARNGGHDPFSIEGDRYFTARALESIKAEPGVYLWYSLQKLAFFWIGHPAIDWPNYGVFSFEDTRLLFPLWRVVGIFIGRLLPLAAIVSLIVLRRRLWDFAPLFAVCGYLMFVHAFTYPEVRYSEPLHPLLSIMFAAAVSERIRTRQEHSRQELAPVAGSSEKKFAEFPSKASTHKPSSPRE